MIACLKPPIFICCDNDSVVPVCNSGKTHDNFLNLCLYELWLLVCKYNIDLHVLHIRGRSMLL